MRTSHTRKPQEARDIRASCYVHRARAHVRLVINRGGHENGRQAAGLGQCWDNWRRRRGRSRQSTSSRSGQAVRPQTSCGLPSYLVQWHLQLLRVMFQSDRREKQGWSTDYPGADINFSVRLAELTKVQVKMRGDDDGEGGDTPDAVVVRLTDDALFKCPFTFMQDAGTARFNALEVERLREYLTKGGSCWSRITTAPTAASNSTKKFAARCRRRSSRSLI